jgi:hypothetical protein
MTTQRKLLAAAVAALLASLAPSAATAQWNVARTDSARTSVYGSYGLDPAVVASIGVARRMPSLGGAQLSAEAGWAVAEVDSRDYRGRIGASGSVVRWRAVRLVGEGTVSVRSTSNSIYRALGFGAASSWTLGVYRPRWFAGTEAGYDKSVATRIVNSEWYRTNFYPDAQDGWYRNGGGTVHYGVTGGVTVGSAELMARAGLLRTERFNEMMPPMYLNLGVGYRF